MATVRVGEFEWDDAKARVNRRKHGVTFEEAMTVFLDELAVPLQEQEHPDRLVLIGESRLARIVLVVFTERVPEGTIRMRAPCNQARAESVCRGRLNHPSARFGTSPRSILRA